LRGGKGSTFEGGLRVPCIAWWPKTISDGRDEATPWSALDVFPTIANVAGCDTDTLVVFHNVALCCIHLQSLAAQGFGDGCALRPIASSGAELHVYSPWLYKMAV
jgi:hypothetical protein